MGPRGLVAIAIAVAARITAVSATFVSESENADSIAPKTDFVYGTACGTYDGQFYSIAADFKNVRLCGRGMSLQKPDWENFDDNLTLKDVWYNGTASLSSKRAGLGSCEKTWTPQTKASLSIGDMLALPSIPASSRSEWDKNPFFFQLYSGNASEFNDEDRFWTVNIKSSSSQFLWGQFWTVNSTKSGDGFDISGRFTTKKMNPLNNLSFRSTSCGSFRVPYINTNWDMQMTGHVSPQAAKMTITMKINNDTTVLDFSGTNWSAGPKLVVSGQQIATEGTMKGTTSAAVHVLTKPTFAGLLSLFTFFLW